MIIFSRTLILKIEICKLDYSRIKIENPDDVTTKKPNEDIDNTYEGEENENENEEENEEDYDEDQEDFSFLGKVLSLLEACFDLISGSSLSMKIQIANGWENY